MPGFPCGCNNCGIADADASSSDIGAMGFAASSGTPLNGSNKVALAAGDSITTTKSISNPGYSITIFFDVTLGTANSQNIRDITAGAMADYEGMRVEILDAADAVIAYYKMPTVKTNDLNGEIFTCQQAEDVELSMVTFENEYVLVADSDPYISKVRSAAKIQLCFSEDAMQFSSWLYYNSGYFEPAVITDADGLVHAHGEPLFVGETGPIALLSVPYVFAGPIKVRVKNDGSTTQTFARVEVIKNHEIDTVDLASTDGYGYEYGCDISTPEEWNITCEPCAAICTVLPGNRSHEFVLTQNDLSTLMDAMVVQFASGCGYGERSYKSSDGPDFHATEYEGEMQYSTAGSVETAGTITDTNTDNSVRDYILTIEQISSDVCEITYLITLKIWGLLIDESFPDDDAAIVADTHAASVTRDVAYDSKGGGIITKASDGLFAASGSMYGDDSPFTSYTWTWNKTVPAWTEQSQEITLELDTAPGAGKAVAWVDRFEMAPKFTGTTITSLLMTTYVNKIDLDGLVIKMVGQ